MTHQNTSIVTTAATLNLLNLNMKSQQFWINWFNILFMRICVGDMRSHLLMLTAMLFAQFVLYFRLAMTFLWRRRFGKIFLVQTSFSCSTIFRNTKPRSKIGQGRRFRAKIFSNQTKLNRII
ncbi:hypothetical protein EGR_11262 [Echinococcus granulosus]|uniref:Transmembrane protein n=1 Tax=Echinococcus granulosus TaxID=6210 RepID=W6TYM1_ECHGR|nr:hypothetical protein EGR_11262 [Echinococcus granulosus]EUB53885.1 hypothetical protein EGR_11262 [Echinococcus granulosus]